MELIGFIQLKSCNDYTYYKGAFMLNFWVQNQRFQTWLEQNAVASMLIFE